MSYDRQHGKFVFECDACEEVCETNEFAFMDAVEVVKQNGWKCQRSGLTWLHFCPSCAG